LPRTRSRACPSENPTPLTPTLAIDSRQSFLDACPVCRGGAPTFAFLLSRGPVAECPDCGVYIAQDRWTSTEQDRKFHDCLESRYVEYFEPFRKSQYRHALSRLPATQGTLLDIGASYGWMIEVGSEFGFDSYGVEPSPMQYEPALATRIFGRTLAEHAKQTERSFDVVTLWHVLEHLRDPTAAADQIRSLLVEGGRVVIAVPNARGRMYRLAATLAATIRSRRLLEELWYTGNPNMHRYYFTEEALVHVLRTASLSVADAYTLDAFDWGRIWLRPAGGVGRPILRALGPAIQRSGFTRNENLVVVAQKRSSVL
jgi:2-polyprenyl-3-methyl-5-hydroxy-6-metoxy-1,4-benzoquinol methylase